MIQTSPQVRKPRVSRDLSAGRRMNGPPPSGVRENLLESSIPADRSAEGFEQAEAAHTHSTGLTVMPRLGLALSGGGLRATLFHLGVVRFLRDAGLLRDVTHIVSVSGGSILGAHLALNWERYNASAAEFEAAASNILDFVRFDARNHIARRLPFLVPFRLLRRLPLGGAWRNFTETRLLERLYARPSTATRGCINCRSRPSCTS